MSDNLKKVWGSLQKVGYAVPEYNQFEKDMENEDNLKKVYGSLQKVGYEVPEYGKFKTDMGSIRSQGEGPVIEQPATPVVSPSVKNEEPESSFEPKEDWGKVAQDSLSRGVKKPVDVSTAANNEDGGLPRGHKMIDGQEYITGFGPAFAQGADQLYQGGKGLVGEVANLVTGSSMDERSALATLSSKTNANEELGNEDWFLKRWQSEFQGWDAKSDKEKKALRRDYMADYQHRLQQLTSDLVGQEYTASNGKTKKYGIRDAYDIAKKQLADEQRILEALKESRGDVHEAANSLSEAVANPSWGDKIIDEVNQKNAEYLPTKGFAAYMGNLAPQMIPNAAAIGLMATGNPIAGNVIGKIGMGALTASTAGQSMAEASANGATPWQTASIGLADSAIEYLSELIPFSTYTGKLAKLSKRQLSKELAQALDTPAGREELKNLYLKANKDLGSKLFSKEFGKMYVSDVAAEGLSEFVAEGLETVTPMIYQNPEEYPVLAEVLNNGLEGMKGGVAMGAFLGAVSSSAVNKKRDAIRKANDKVTLAMVDTKGDGNQRICEVIGNAGEDQYLVFDGEEEIAVDKNSVTEPINYTYDEFKAGEINYKVDQSFDNGYNTTDPTVMAQKTKEYEIRRKKAAKALGMTEDEVENLDPRLLVELRDSDGLTRKQYNAALGFFRAQAAFNGMISEAQGRIESETNEVRKQVETRVNPTTGMIHPITLRPIGTEAGQQVYVVRGNVAYTEDGQIDKVNSDQDLWIIDAEGQQPRAIGLAEIESVSPAINPQQEIDEATDAIGNRIANEKEAAMTGKVEMPAGQAYTLEDGRNGVIVNQDEQNIYVAVQNEKGEIEQVAVPVATVQEAADAVGYAEAEKRINDEDAIEEEAEAHPDYDINERVTLTLEDGTPATATIIPSDSDPDVYDVILDERPESGVKIRQMTKQQLDESVVVRNNVEVQPMTKAEERTTSEAPMQESAQVEVEEPQPTVEDTTPKDFRGNALPLNEDGSVRQSELFSNDPEAWAKWNDEKHADNGANSAKYIAAAEKNAQAQLDQMRTAYDEEMDFDKRDAMEAEMKALEGKINTYKTIAENYRTGEGQLFSRVDGATKPRNAVYTDVANAAVGMTRKYGNKVQFITSIEDLGKLEASEKNGALKVIQSGQQVRGWYNPASGEAYIYLPDVESVEALNKVVTHEVLTHKGLRELMGEEAYKKYCEDVYRKVMTPAQRHFFYDVYNEGRLDEAAAGDEFLAHMAQATDLTAEQEKSLWGKIADKVKSVFKGDETIDFGTDDDFIAKLLKTSYANTIRDVNLEESYKAMKDYVAKYNGDAEDRKDEKKTTEEPQGAETKVVGGSEESRMSKLTGEEDGIRFSKEDLGTPFYQFKGDAKGAIEFLKARKEGQAVAALHHRDIGDIDLVWGREGTGDSDGYGLAKLIKYHPEVLDNLQEILDNSTIVKRGENRIKLDSPKYATTVSLNWYGADKKWLLTSYEKKNSVLDNTMNTGETISGKRNDTPTPQNTVSESKDTNSQEENNTLLSKIDNVDRAIAMTTGRDVNEVHEERMENAISSVNDMGMEEKDGDIRFSLRFSPKESEYDKVVNDIAMLAGVSKRRAKKWLDSETSLASIILREDARAFLDYVADDREKAIKDDSDYPQGTVDFNNICRKRAAFTYIYQRLQEANPNRIITGEDLADIRQIMMDHKMEVACGLCYVEDRRQLLGEIAKEFIDSVNDNFAAYANKMDAKGVKSGTKAKNAEKFRKMIGDDVKADLNIYDLITLDGSTKLYNEHRGIYDAFIAFNAARGQQSGNLFKGYAEYKREILKWNDKKVKKVNDNGGLRIFSYSDFEAHHLIDIVQIIQDAAVRGVKIQGYTKVPAFAKAVANTGIKLNRSLIPLGDTGLVHADGTKVTIEELKAGNVTDARLGYDPVEGIDVNDPNFEESNANIGNILIGINDEQIRMAMADPFVHYIIPYHSNQKLSLRKKKQTGAWTNYKNYQTDKGGKMVNIYTNILNAAETDGNPIKNERQFTERFLQICKERGLTPRFAQFLNTNDAGEYVYTPGYYKMLLDFKLFDENGRILPQQPVIAEFNDEFNKQILEDYVRDSKTQDNAEYDKVIKEISDKLQMNAPEGMRYSKTYHGSGADFKEFDTKFMSTGEGNQAYGWGTYVTTNEQTGRRYAEVSSATPTGAAKADASAKDIVAAQIYDIMDKDPLKTFDEAKKELLATEDSRYTKDDVNSFKESDLGKYGPRHLYEVEIPDDNGFNYLHWDAPMTMKQAKAIQDEIAKQYGDQLKETYGDDYMREIKSVIGYGTEGSHVEGGLNYLLGNIMDYSTGIDRGAERNSRLLSDAGIVGMEVAVDRRNGSRYAGSNYVIYDTKDAQITAHTRFSKVSKEERDKFRAETSGKPVDISNAILKNELVKLDTGSGVSLKKLFKGIKDSTGQFKYCKVNFWPSQDGGIHVDDDTMLSGMVFIDGPFTVETYKNAFGYSHVLIPDGKILSEEAGAKYVNPVELADILDDELDKFAGLYNQRYGEENTRFSKANADQAMFVSNADQAVNSLNMGKASGEQWIKAIQGRGGLKAGEDKWIGLSQWLSEQTKPVTKDEVLKFIDENKIRIEEQKYSQSWSDKEIAQLEERFGEGVTDAFDYDTDAMDPSYQTVRSIGRDSEDFYNKTHKDSPLEYDDYGDLTEESEDRLDSFIKEVEDYLNKGIGVINSTRLQYTTEGLDNKREIALTVPAIEPWNEGDQIHFGDAGNGRAIAWVRFGDTDNRLTNALYGKESRMIANDLEARYGANWWHMEMPEADAKLKEVADALVRLQGDAIDSKNQEVMELAYKVNNAKTDEQKKVAEAGWQIAVRELADLEKEQQKVDEYLDGMKSSRILVIDEIQSKRHQEGREKGYGTTDPGAEERYFEFINRMREKYGFHEWQTSLTSEESEEYNKVLNDKQGIKELVPPAPFEKNWHELAMKRMLRLAAEEGYDKIAWTSGDMQAERYDISGYVPEIDVYTDMHPAFGNEAAFKQLSFELNGTKYSPKINRDGVIVSSCVIGNSQLRDKNISEVFGKEIAEAVMSTTKPNETIEVGKVVGGEGMKGFYDDILPRFMDKYGKKWGVKTRDLELPVGEGTWHSIDVTPEMKESVMEGQVMFSKISSKQGQARPDAVGLEEGGIRYSFIGEKGAKGIDEALFGLGEEGRKMDDLEVAKKMEEEGKDAKAIKLATGWERGVDELWRYEISTPHFKSLSAASFDLDESKKLGDIISDGEIFQAYPQLRDVEVSAVKLPNDTYGQYGSGSIELNVNHLPKKDGKYAIFSAESVRTLHHELQHAIQKIEGFASRSTTNITADDLMKAVKNNENVYIFAQLFGSNPLNRMLAQNPARLADMIRRDSPRFNGGLKARVPSLIQALEDMSQDEYSNLVRAAKNGIKSARANATKNYFKSANEVESRNVEARIFMTDEQRRNSLAMETEDVPREEQIVLYSKVADPNLIKKLDSEPVEEWYGSMTWLNPEETDKSKWMFVPVKSAKDSKGQLREASSIDQWEQSEEDLEGLKSGKYDLKDVDNDVVGGVNYNPYFHVSNSLMNDQFTGAYNKPNTVVVKFLVPKSELYPEGEAYHAEGAKNHVGVLPWHSGTINAKLPADKQRSVALTRWRKPVGIASNEEVAKFIATKLKEANTSMPWNLVTPGVLAELDKIGAPISEGAGSAKMKGVPRPIERYSRVPVDISGATIKGAPIRLTSSNGIRLDKPFSGIKGNTEVIREVRVDFEPGNLGSVSVEKSIGGHATIFGPFKYEAEGKGFRFIPDGEIITKDEDGLLYLHPGKVSEQLFDILGQIAEYKNRGAVRFSRLSSDGLRKLSDKIGPEAYDKFARDVFFTDEDARKSIINLAKGMDWNFLKASKEYLASLADVWEPSESDRKIYDKVRELYDKPLTDEEARYLMWRKGTREKGAFGVAEDIVMQKNLEVGDFKNDGVQFSKFSIFGNNGKRSQQNSDGRSEGIIRSAVAGDPARKLAIRRDLGDIQGYRDGLAARSSEYSLLDSQIEKERFVSETLVNRAKEAGQYIAWDKAEEMGLPFKGKTMESLVMKDGNRVVKLKDPFAASAIKGNEPIDAIIEHVVHNILFPNTPYKFLGITEDYKGDMRFVLEQPFIKSIEEADQNDVVDFLENNLGLRDEGREQYGNNFVSVIDAFGENVLIDEDGELNFIDPIIKLKGNGDGVIKELLGEENTMFSKSVGQATDRYNEAVRVINKKGEKKATANLFWRMKEAYLDSMKALKELQNAIAEETGKPIKDFENAYIAENAMSSKNQAGADEFQVNYMTRILDALKDLYRVGRTQKDIVEYLIAKHGLERNEIFQQREEAKLRKELGEKLSQLDEAADGYQQRHDELLYEYEQKILDTHRDYSGLTDLTGSKDDYAERARRIVGVFEGTNPEGTARLWRAINAATKRALEINYGAGLLDKEAYENLRGMFKYYIPLRGWDRDVASHEYNYLGGDGPLREKTIKTAEGRTSVSDDPIATINKMAYDAIALANRNLMKQKLLNLAENHPTNLLRVSEQWYTKNAATGEWEGVSPDIPEDATGEEITRIIDEFESRMKQAEADGNAKRQRNGLTLSKHATGFEKKEHEVRVRRAGKEYVIYVNGNPRAAQAVNGLTNPSNDPSVIKQGLQNIKNLMAQAFTSKNPAFIFANLSRDSLFAASSVFAKESGSYTAQYVRNYARNLKKMTGLVRKLNNGTLDESSLIERYFHEFVKNGGETGYTNIVTVDSYKKKLKRLEKEIRNGAAGQLPKKAWDGIWDGVEFLNRSAEDVTRFAVYMTSRQMGRSVARSVYDAKEVTVNFNKKGSGGYLAQQMNFAYIFFNACVQSAANLGRLIKSHPGKMGAIFGTYLAGGMLQPMLITALQEALGHGDDDDDKSYWDLPEWVRRNNLIFWVPFTNMYINIPLPQELRPLFGIGEIAASVAFDKENINDGIAKGAEGLSGIMPIDLTGNGGNMAINFTPTALQPVAQLIANKDFFGVPIYKKNEFNKENPDWTKAYKGTSSVLVNGTKWLSNITGGDNVVKGNVDLNPAIIEHLFEGYLGGLGKTLNKSAKSIMMLAGNEDWNMRNVPIASSFVQVPDERNTGSQTNREYYNLLDEYKEAQHKYNGYVNQTKREGGIYRDEYAKKIDEYTNTEDYARFMKMKPYVNAIDRLNTKKKNLPQDMVEEVDKQIADLKKEMISKMKGNE